MKTGLILPLLLLGVVGNAPPAIAQSPGTFTATGRMTTERVGHTATLLTTGRVLIAGGTADNKSALASAELYDPSTGTFTATGNMTMAHWSHTATLLPNGKVLIAGGGSDVDLFGSLALAGAELYDPSTGTFAATGDMTAPRQWHTATLLNNGKVLVVGGLSGPLFPGGALLPSGTLLASAELYDPSTGTFTAIGIMISARDLHTATLLSNGKVLIQGSGGGLSPAPELYDPGTATFSLVTNAPFRPFPRGYTDTATLLTNGKVLFTFGNSNFLSVYAEVYDPSTGTFTETGNLTSSRGESETATLLPDGMVLIAGTAASHNSELYDLGTGTFSPTGDMATSRGSHTAALLPDGTVLISAGWGPRGALASAEIYRPAVLVPAPALFGILHAATHQVVSSSNPSVAGEALEIYGTGLIDGSVIPPQVAIGGRMAEVLFFGKAPGFAGLNQVNVLVPSGVVVGDAVPVRLNYLNRPSNEVTMGVK